MQPIRSCHRDGVFYTGQVRINWNFLRLALLAGLPLAVSSCGGISASRSVSPLDFILPGAGHFLKADPAPTNTPSLFPEISTEIASVK